MANARGTCFTMSFHELDARPWSISLIMYLRNVALAYARDALAASVATFGPERGSPPLAALGQRLRLRATIEVLGELGLIKTINSKGSRNHKCSSGGNRGGGGSSGRSR